MTQQVACPGDRLFPEATHISGPGTYTKDSFVCAGAVGRVAVTSEPGQAKATVQVRRKGAQSLIPSQGDTVWCKVSKVNPRLAVVDILCVGSQALEAKYTGIVRAQDVRASEVDKVELQSCFRPGDLLRAEVISPGDSQSCYLSTAKNELGVILAKSLAGVPMVPISWQEMQCPQTKTVEKRKVAKQT